MKIIVPKISLFNTIKHYLSKRLFRDEYRKIEIQREAFVILSEALEKKEQAFLSHRQSLTLADLCRENLKLVTGKRLLYEDFFTYMKEKEGYESEEDILRRVHNISSDKILMEVMNFLIMSQLVLTHEQGNSKEDLISGQGTVNGIQTVKDEIQRLSGVFVTKYQSSEDEYDEHSVV